MERESSDHEDEEEDSTVHIPKNGKNQQLMQRPILQFGGNRKKSAIVNFSVSYVLLGPQQDQLDLIKQYHMTFKFIKTESKIVRRVLGAHGFKEAHPYSNNYNLMWSGGHFRPYTLRGINEFQKVNHFPRSFELTRKDKLYRNIQRMQQCKGVRHFDFVPAFYVLPTERSDFHNAFLRDKGPWIVKPVASSRGRGIFLIKDANMVPHDEQVLVCRYIENPLLVNGFKFDCRIYVAVTSFDPLIVYMYKEGLARFSTVKYEKNFNNIRNLWMHLTNYSIQKNNENYVKCEDPEVDNFGSKWSFSALLRHLKNEGIDTKELMSHIEDLIVKTMLSVEFSVGTACRMFVPHKNSCFELFGFDVLIDENLKPWLLEVNLSPSLACESPLDLKIKANLVTDLFNLVGFQARDPVVVKSDRVHTSTSSSRAFKQRYRTLSSSNTDLRATKSASELNKNIGNCMSNEELRMIREAKEEYKRRGKFVRVYPTPESWELYSSLQEHSSSKNKTLHSGLFPELWSSSQRPASAKYMARARTFSNTNIAVCKDVQAVGISNGMVFQNRYKCYEKKLESWDQCFSNDQESPIQNGNERHDARLAGAIYENELIGKDVNTAIEFNFSKIIQYGDNLSKTQAREAFAVYLERVQARLMKEISASVQRRKISGDEESKQQDQMDLIVRFLKKAAANFQSPMVIAAPSRKLLFHERQRLLARQLRDFVAVYRKETLNLSKSNKDDHKHLNNDNPFSTPIEDDAFLSFLHIASENELEELLSAYTRSNQAASIFLGQKSHVDRKESHEANMKNNSRPSKSSTWREFLQERNFDDSQKTIQKFPSCPDSAVKIYSQPLTKVSRPVSANAKIRQVASLKFERQRPASAVDTENMKQQLNNKGRQPFKSKDFTIQTISSNDEEKLNNLKTGKAIRNHFRHSSAPIQGRRTNINQTIETGPEISLHSLKNAAKYDADVTFESFVSYENTFLKEDENNNVNEIQRTASTQTFDGEELKRRNQYFSQRESKRVDANVKRAQKAYYDSYLKQLNEVAPHPPSHPPAIKKPVNTMRMNRIMSKNKDKM